MADSGQKRGPGRGKLKSRKVLRRNDRRQTGGDADMAASVAGTPATRADRREAPVQFRINGLCQTCRRIENRPHPALRA